MLILSWVLFTVAAMRIAADEGGVISQRDGPARARVTRGRAIPAAARPGGESNGTYVVGSGGVALTELARLPTCVSSNVRCYRPATGGTSFSRPKPVCVYEGATTGGNGGVPIPLSCKFDFGEKPDEGECKCGADRKRMWTAGSLDIVEASGRGGKTGRGKRRRTRRGAKRRTKVGGKRRGRSLLETKTWTNLWSMVSGSASDEAEATSTLPPPFSCSCGVFRVGATIEGDRVEYGDQSVSVIEPHPTRSALDQAKIDEGESVRIRESDQIAASAKPLPQGFYAGQKDSAPPSTKRASFDNYYSFQRGKTRRFVCRQGLDMAGRVDKISGDVAALDSAKAAGGFLDGLREELLGEVATLLTSLKDSYANQPAENWVLNLPIREAVEKATDAFVSAAIVAPKHLLGDDGRWKAKLLMTQFRIVKEVLDCLKADIDAVESNPEAGFKLHYVGAWTAYNEADAEKEPYAVLALKHPKIFQLIHGTVSYADAARGGGDAAKGKAAGGKMDQLKNLRVLFTYLSKILPAVSQRDKPDKWT